MKPLDNRYIIIIEKISSMVHAHLKVTTDKTFDEAKSENMNILYDIAVEMREFKKFGGNLRHDYGEGILIQMFFDKIISDFKKIESLNEAQLMKLDEEIGAKTGVYAYKEMRQEYREYIYSQRTSRSPKLREEIVSHKALETNNKDKRTSMEYFTTRRPRAYSDNSCFIRNDMKLREKSNIATSSTFNINLEQDNNVTGVGIKESKNINNNHARNSSLKEKSITLADMRTSHYAGLEERRRSTKKNTSCVIS